MFALCADFRTRPEAPGKKHHHCGDVGSKPDPAAQEGVTSGIAVYSPSPHFAHPEQGSCGSPSLGCGDDWMGPFLVHNGGFIKCGQGTGRERLPAGMERVLG